MLFFFVTRQSVIANIFSKNSERSTMGLSLVQKYLIFRVAYYTRYIIYAQTYGTPVFSPVEECRLFKKKKHINTYNAFTYTYSK